MCEEKQCVVLTTAEPPSELCGGGYYHNRQSVQGRSLIDGNAVRVGEVDLACPPHDFEYRLSSNLPTPRDHPTSLTLARNISRVTRFSRMSSVDEFKQVVSNFV